MTKAPALRVAPLRRSFAVYAGVSPLPTHKTREAAEAALAANPAFYAYWAGSLGVSLENSPVARVIAA